MIREHFSAHLIEIGDLIEVAEFDDYPTPITNIQDDTESITFTVADPFGNDFEVTYAAFADVVTLWESEDESV